MRKIVHLGIGNFHRAHQAWYTQQTNRLDGDHWRIIGVSLQRSDMRDALRPQGFGYYLAIKGADGARYEKMDVHDTILVAREAPAAVTANISDPATSIVTLTITEKGYHADPATGGLNLNSDEVAVELTAGEPVTAIGFLAHGLAARQARGAGPITVISCDNLAENGRLLEGLVRDFATTAGLDVTDYLDDSVTFPNTMVDRIVPATTDRLRAEVERQTDFHDASPVSTEAFSEWVIEDKFAGPCPTWEKVGATLVNDVAPYELRKLRMLNGAHSLLAYSGLLAGHTYVHEAIGDPKLRALASGVMDEAAQTLPDITRSSAPAYRDALFERFANPSLNHELAQIAMDGSMKLPVRILPILAGQGEQSTGSFADKAISYWLAWVMRQLSDSGVIHDPKEAEFRQLGENTGNARELASALLASLGPVPQPNTIVDQALNV